MKASFEVLIRHAVKQRGREGEADIRRISSSSLETLVEVASCLQLQPCINQPASQVSLGIDPGSFAPRANKHGRQSSVGALK